MKSLPTTIVLIAFSNQAYWSSHFSVINPPDLQEILQFMLGRPGEKIRLTDQLNYGNPIGKLTNMEKILLPLRCAQTMPIKAYKKGKG